MYTLAFETSCDETSAAVLKNDTVLSNVILSQYFHSEFGGVVPEIASREHLKSIVEITEKALKEANIHLKDINIVAATSEPGLIGALLIGLNFAKSLALSLKVPFVPVNHIQGHIYSSFIQKEKFEFPFISLIVSGGHTLLIEVQDFFRHNLLGTTVDDAAGEAFDKVAKMLGLGYPGGPEIDRLAKKGNPDFHKFPLAHIKNKPYDFSFSGIKTSVLYFLREINYIEDNNDKLTANICASFQKAVVDSLFLKAKKAAENLNIKSISVSGGVSANTGLKEKFSSLINKGYRIYLPEPSYSTDNAGMVGITGYFKYMHTNDKAIFNDVTFNSRAMPRIKYEAV
ncbi:MAG: tRNA (adenosine(37)-N6)-threonylcarbamoyltransferase complex transferase subunit TsaD [Ignavibacteriae bacterium]|nr:tRNA (adenosine(37)-N6)-threonylcarbamoyltransferase complex transferase subunit TsaD [Ignavibacteriota bacterium]